MKNKIFLFFSILFLLAAMYHFAGIFYEVNSSPTWRNALFAGINLAVVYGLLKRPKYFVYLFFILLFQQFYSHGQTLLKLWTEQKMIDWMGVGVLSVLTVVFILMVIEQNQAPEL